MSQVHALVPIESMNPQDYIPKPCHENWSQMSGDAKKKFCDKCSCSVHNLTGMDHDQIMTLRSELGGKLCGAFQASSEPVRSPLHKVLLKRKLLIGASISSLALAACQSEKDRDVVGGVEVCYPPESETSPEVVPEESEVLLGDICPIEEPKHPEIKKQEPRIMGKIRAPQ